MNHPIRNIIEKLIIIIFLIVISSCSLLKSKEDRCFDLFEKYGNANMNIYERGSNTFSCTSGDIQFYEKN
jgi:hypothetical protein